MASKEQIESFLASPAFGVVGASADRHKFGNKVLRCYQQHELKAYPINPRESKIEEVPCIATITDLPPEVKSISMITPPQVTEKLVPLAIEKGIENIWMQPGAESPEAVLLCRQNNINVIADGSCILVVLGYRDH